MTIFFCSPRVKTNQNYFKLSLVPFDTGFDHVTGHEFEAGLQVFAKLFFWPVEISNERLQSVQLPEEVFGCARAITAEQPQLNQCRFIQTEMKMSIFFITMPLVALFGLRSEDGDLTGVLIHTF